MESKAEEILKALANLRMGRNIEEYDIHAAIAEALRKEDIAFIHEYRLMPRCRLDFLVGKTAIEVKKNRPAPSALIRQITNYLESDELNDIIIVTQHSVRLPQKICGKSVYQLSLDRLWGVSLP